MPDHDGRRRPGRQRPVTVLAPGATTGWFRRAPWGPPHGTMRSRMTTEPTPARSALRPEDILLAAWNVVALPVGALLGGTWLGDGPAPLLGLIEVLAIVGVVIALATRTPDAAPLTPESFRGWAIAGPLIGAVAFVGDDASDRLGLDVAPLGIVAFVAIVGSFVLADRLPVLPEAQRRIAVTPFILISSAFFTDLVAGLFDGIDLVAIARGLFDGAATDPELVAAGGILVGALVFGSAVFYAMLVVAPRELAAREPLARVWLVRYLVFIASAAIGAAGFVIL